MKEFPGDKSDEEWKARLTPMEYRVFRQAHTERRFTGEHNNNYSPGLYRCAACQAPLFVSETKFDHGCGWPSFYAAAAGDSIVLRPEPGFFEEELEVLCANCGGHLGHLFDDGPEPTGNRYCINSVCLKFEPL